MKISIQKAKLTDIPEIAKVRMLWDKSEPAFLSELVSSGIINIFTYLQKIEPDCFYIVKRDDKIVGYNVATLNTRRLMVLLMWRHFFFLMSNFLLSIKTSMRIKSKTSIMQILEIFIYAIRCTHAQASLSFFIVEKCRNLGMGSKLLSFLLDYFSKKGVKKVDVIVNSHNLDAQRFYGKKGFVKKRKMRYSPKLLIMTKELEL